MTTPPRRERLRTATVAEIKDGARRLLVTGGPQAISLRAIARDMGMTAPAIYRYPRVWRRWSSNSPPISTTSYDGTSNEPGTPPATIHWTSWSRWHGRSASGRFVTRPSLRSPSAARSPGWRRSRTAAWTPTPGARFGAAFLRPLVELWHRFPFPTPPAEVLRPSPPAGRSG